MKIVLINGQNHKGSTYHVARQLAEKIACDAEIKEVFLPRDMPHFCIGCAACFMTGETKCPHYATLEPLNALMDEAELMIFASPVYVFHCTGSMKAFLDHYGYRWLVHRPDEKMFHKQAVCISTAAGGGMRSTNKDMRHSLFFWGVRRIYCYGVGVQAIKWDEVTDKKRAKIDKATTRLAKAVRRGAGKTAPGLKTRALFYVMRLVNRKGWNAKDSEYWREKDWVGKARPWKTAP